MSSSCKEILERAPAAVLDSVDAVIAHVINDCGYPVSTFGWRHSNDGSCVLWFLCKESKAICEVVFSADEIQLMLSKLAGPLDLSNEALGQFLTRLLTELERQFGPPPKPPTP